MKREILFRGKRVKDGKWVEGLLTKDIKGHIRIQYNPRNFSVVVNPETVGQFTGMTDMKKIILALLLLPTLASAAQKLPPEVSAALQFNKWYISQLMSGKEPLTDYAALNATTVNSR